MNSPAEIVRILLIQLGIGTVAGGNWPVYVGYLPATPDDALAVFDTAGTMEGRIMGSGEKIEHPGLQFRIRANGYLETYAKTRELATALDRVRRVTVDGESDDGSYLILNISRQGAPIPLGAEPTDARRFLFTINAITTIQEKED